MQVKSLILTGFGINCEVEMGAAYKNAGADINIIHFNDLLNGKYKLKDYDILNFPGGFSFGDDIASGKVMANKIKFKKTAGGKTLVEEIKHFVNQGKYVLGICNGFQILTQLGLLPDTEQQLEPEAALLHNDSQKYEDRWVYCKVNPDNTSPWLQGVEIIPLPVRHGEGKWIFKNEEIKQKILKNNQIALQYSNKKGDLATEYPQNPNGSILSIAGVTDKTGRIFGLMPHPEAFLSFYNHPAWTSLQRKEKILPREKTGQKFFDNIVSHIRKTKK
jgi:phosphoribosylformylglycinamidine synthase